MSEQPKNPAAPDSLTTNGNEGCVFPIEYDPTVAGEFVLCGRQTVKAEGPGRPSSYCDGTKHERARAYVERKRLKSAAIGGPSAVGHVRIETVVPDRPVTEGRRSFGALLVQFTETARATEEAAAARNRELAGLLAHAEQIVREVSDPEASAYEVEEAHRQADVRVAEAQSAQAAAELDAREARRSAEREAGLRSEAEAATEAALAELEQVKAETAAELARIRADTDTAVAEHQQRAEQAVAAELAAREELKRVRVEAAEALTAAQAEAEKHKRQTIADRDRVLAEREAQMRRRIEQDRAEAAELVTATQVEAQSKIEAAERAAEEAAAQASALVKTAQAELAEANTAKTHAEADKRAAERRAEEDRATTERLRAELEQQRADYHQELAELREEIRAEREGMRQERTTHAQQLAAVLATVQAATVPAGFDAPTGEQTGRRAAARKAGGEQR